MKINTSDFNFTRNSKVIKEINNNTINLPNIYYKKLGITKKETNNIFDKLEDAKIQKKIIKYITDYKKIPKKTIYYFKNLESMYSKNLESMYSEENALKEISDDEIKQIIIDYLRIKYNEYSIFDIDISFIYFQGWNKNCLSEEGPSDYIFDRIKELNKKKSSCVVM